MVLSLAVGEWVILISATTVAAFLSAAVVLLLLLAKPGVGTTRRPPRSTRRRRQANAREDVIDLADAGGMEPSVLDITRDRAPIPDDPVTLRRARRAGNLRNEPENLRHGHHEV